MDGMALDKIAFINNTKDIYVADAVYNGIEGLNVTLYSYRDGREESVSVPGDRSPQLFIDAINQISDHIYNQIKNKTSSTARTNLKLPYCIPMPICATG